MFTMLLGSGFTRAYIDQPCTLRMPTEFKPKADVPKPHQLSQQELKDFYVNGFIGPFDCFSPTEMAGFKKEMLAMEKTKSKTYDFVTPRDRHFEAPGSFPFGLQRAQMTNDTGHQPLFRRSYADSAKIADLQQQVVTDVMSDAVV